MSDLGRLVWLSGVLDGLDDVDDIAGSAEDFDGIDGGVTDEVPAVFTNIWLVGFI
jgi:hypothetical protein